MALLSVNLNKIALLRNARHTDVPDLAAFARSARAAGAHGLTVHPRPDERHIRASDVDMLAELMAPWRPAFELNVEGYPEPRLMTMVERLRPEQCTLVPDAPGAFTSDAGWRLDGSDDEVARLAVERLRGWGCRPILFIDPDPAVPARAASCGAAGIEIYTGGYAAEMRHGGEALLEACARTGEAARQAGLRVNIGHDLNLANMAPLLARMPYVAEASIGHELTADALMMGWQAAIGAYARLLGQAAASTA